MSHLICDMNQCTPNLQNGMCAQGRLKSAWAPAQFDQPLLCAQWVARDPSFLHAESEDWSGWADAQVDLSLRWVHMPLCRFCHAPVLHPKHFGLPMYPHSLICLHCLLWRNFGSLSIHRAPRIDSGQTAWMCTPIDSWFHKLCLKVHSQLVYSKR